MDEEQKTRLANLRWLLQNRFEGVIAALARAIGRSANQTRLLINPDAEGGRKMGEKLARSIEQDLGLPPRWLDEKHEGVVDASAQPLAAPDGEYCPPDDRRHDLRRDGDRRRDGELDIPHLNRTGSMGPGAIADGHEYPVGHMRVEMPWLRKNVDYSRPDNLALIDGRGGSMEPTYRDGDILLVDRGQTNLDIDAVYVLVELATGELFIKGIQRMGLKNYLMISHAPTNRDVPIGDGSGYQVIGRVVYAWNGKKL